MADDLTTADVLARMPKENGFTALLRAMAERIPANTENRLSMLNMAKGGLNSAANWLDWKPEIGPDTLAPLGVSAISALARPGRVPHQHFDLTPTERMTGSGNPYGPVEMAYVPNKDGVYLGGIQTDQDKRGRGYGRAAMEQFLEETDAAGKPVGLTSLDDPRLWKFYASLGFKNSSGRIWERDARPPRSETMLFADPSRASLSGTIVNDADTRERLKRAMSLDRGDTL
jgi:hypothetical protein